MPTSTMQGRCVVDAVRRDPVSALGIALGLGLLLGIVIRR
jgi:ElaB/YqjD/DUF883 family membrane-anchored ribosome-binding protein